MVVALEALPSVFPPIAQTGSCKPDHWSCRLLRRMAMHSEEAEFSARDELKRNTVHAITEASRLGSILENMPEVASAAVTMNLGAEQEKEAPVL